MSDKDVGYGWGAWLAMAMLFFTICKMVDRRKLNVSRQGFFAMVRQLLQGKNITGNASEARDEDTLIAKVRSTLSLCVNASRRHAVALASTLTPRWCVPLASIGHCPSIGPAVLLHIAE